MPLLAIIGPTAVGKSALALRLAGEYNGEIINADSRQVYRYLNIGTAKPTSDEKSRIPHHLIDIIDPDQSFSLAEYQELAFRKIQEVQARGCLPILVGGTGQYVWAVLENWVVPRVPPNLELRRRLEERAEREGIAALYTELVSRDPESAARTDPRNLRRVVRALEVSYLGGDAPAKRASPFDSLIIGLNAPRPNLYQRIEARLNEMIAAGFLSEAQGLLERGYSAALPALSSIGYRQMMRHLAGEISLEEAATSVNIDSHRLVRQQYNWFKPTDERIHWFDVTVNPYPEISRLVAELRPCDFGG